MRDFWLGGTTLERRCRFFLGAGILVLSTSFTIFAIGQMDAMVVEQRRLDGPASGQQRAENQAATDQAGFASSDGYPSRGEPLTLAIHRRRAYLIGIAEVATILAVTLSNAVIRHAFRHRHDPEAA